MGPSGSGKSTLMHILAGLDRPTEGNVWIDGQEITTLRERALTQLRRDKIGFIFQTFNLLPTLTAAENIVLPLTIAGRKSDDGWIDQLVATVGLGDRLSTSPPSSAAGSSSAWPSPARWPRAPPSSSPTSPPATSTRARARRCCSSSGTRWTRSARPS